MDRQHPNILARIDPLEFDVESRPNGSEETLSQIPAVRIAKAVAIRAQRLAVLATQYIHEADHIALVVDTHKDRSPTGIGEGNRSLQ